MISEIARLLRSGAVQADARVVGAAPSEEEVREVLLPVLEWCNARPEPMGRGLVGIAAPPAAGKTTLVVWLAATARAKGWRQFGFFSLDGYHLPNAVLDARTGVDPEGNTVSLRKLKGTPASFDAERLLADLRRLKGGREECRLPVYSRELHDPVPDAVRIGPEVAWVFVEGNFLFLDAPPWGEIRALLDRRIFLDAEEALLRARLAARHGRAGRDAAWIEAHYGRTDGPNIRLARETACRAELVLCWDGAGRLSQQRQETS